MSRAQPPEEGGAETDAGIQVEMVVSQPGDCPVADVSAQCSTTVDSVARSSDPDGDCDLAEFTVPGDATPQREDVTPVFATGSKTRYRCQYESTEPCVCEFVEAYECPVADVHAIRGDLYVTFYTPDMETIRDIVTDAREEFGTVRLRHLCHSGDLDSEDPVVVDRGQLTDRQREVLATAYELGYFEHPKSANAGEVAAELGIAVSTFSEHLAAAQGKLLGAILDE